MTDILDFLGAASLCSVNGGAPDHDPPTDFTLPIERHTGLASPELAMRPDLLPGIVPTLVVTGRQNAERDA
ncbi:MAG: hypothetical protein EON58_02780 [Alphaproteobacteria bacterium]|nr:MAG: hypothetical protein EON58_02780 [Alphaproteobacteria bacterium]